MYHKSSLPQHGMGAFPDLLSAANSNNSRQDGKNTAQIYNTPRQHQHNCTATNTSQSSMTPRKHLPPRDIFGLICTAHGDNKQGRGTFLELVYLYCLRTYRHSSHPQKSKQKQFRARSPLLNNPTISPRVHTIEARMSSVRIQIYDSTDLSTVVCICKKSKIKSEICCVGSILEGEGSYRCTGLNKAVRVNLPTVEAGFPEEYVIRCTPPPAPPSDGVRHSALHVLPMQNNLHGCVLSNGRR